MNNNIQDNKIEKRLLMPTIGNVSVGKSCFLNALFGINCLQVQSDITTKFILFIRHIDGLKEPELFNVIPIKNKGFEFKLEEVSTTEYSLYYKNQPKEKLIFWASANDNISIKEQYPWQMSYVKGGNLNNELTKYKKYIGESYAEMYRIQQQLSAANKQHNDSLFFTILHRTNVSELEQNVENMRLKYVANHPIVDSLLSVIK